jgi:protein-disulfide isomerase
MRIAETYGDKVQIVFRDFPLSFHDRAQATAEAAQCANAQGKFWEYHDEVFANQKSLDDASLKQYAANVGLDTASFNTCLDSGQFKNDVAQDFAEGQRFGVRGTPAFFVNGRFLSGNQPYENLAKVIDEELESKGVATR